MSDEGMPPVKKQKVEIFIITDLFENEPSLDVDKKDILVVQDLAKRVYEISQTQEMAEKIQLWKDHNSLKKTRPPVIAFPENGYFEIIPESSLITKDPFIREYEWYLRHLIYHGDELKDDYVVTSRLKVPPVFSVSGWGITEHWEQSDADTGAAKVTQVIKEESDIEKLSYPELYIDKATTERNFEYVSDIFGDILDVKEYYNVIHWWTWSMGLVGYLSRARGMDQIFLDMYDRPKWVHKAMDFLCNGLLKFLKDVEKKGYLELNNADDYAGTGGLGFTEELPQEDFDGKVRLIDMWGSRESQEMQGLSPAMLDEFVLPYQIRIFENFGLNCYGCCEDLSQKFDLVKKIPRIRRVSVAPWTDMKIASQELEDKYVYSWKPNPAILAMESFDGELIRKKMSEGLDIAKDNITEVIMKDNHTFRNEPDRLEKWVDITKELAYKYE
jgi:hypothetical protein